MDRRELLIATQGLLLSSLVAPPSIAQAASEPRTIVMTGANSGIGLEACKRLAQNPQNTLILACRTLAKAQATAEALREFPAQTIPAACDLASLDSIRSFAQSAPNKVDTLCLNAGFARNTAATDVARTADGFELTVGTNHFGHFYLTHYLLPKVQRSIVVTASGVHDPNSPGGAQGTPATLGDLAGLQDQGKACAMLDGGAYNPDKAYKDSKLCNVLFTRELDRRVGRQLQVNAFNPGLIVSTGLFRDQNAVFTKLFDVVATDVFKVGETPEWGGAALEYMATQVETKGQYYTSPPGSSKYGEAAFGKQFAVAEVSKEAQDDAKAKKLWELSEKVLGIATI